MTLLSLPKKWTQKAAVVSFMMAALGVFVAGTASATLILRSAGMVYDDDLDITWLGDANYAMTSGYDADGHMGWQEAKPIVKFFNPVGGDQIS